MFICFYIVAIHAAENYRYLIQQYQQYHHPHHEMIQIASRTIPFYTCLSWALQMEVEMSLGLALPRRKAAYKYWKNLEPQADDLCIVF